MDDAPNAPAMSESPLERLQNACALAAGWFRDYEAQHVAKRTPEGYRRAAVNAARAEAMEEAAGIEPPASLIPPPPPSV